MDYFTALAAEDNTEKETVRSAVLLGKIRYDQQLSPFVRTSKARLESSLVQSELGRIIAEVSKETNADPEKVGLALRSIIADVATTEPKKEELPAAGKFGDDTYSEGAPSGKDEKEPKLLDGVEHTDVNDHGPVLEKEILDADDQIDITKPLNSESCVRCKKESALEESPVCQVCTDALVALAKKKEALAPQRSFLPPPGENSSGRLPQPQQQQAQPMGPPSHVMPLNSNAPYQCTVCGRVGTWDEVNNHLQTAQDVNHIQAIQNLKAQDANMGMQPQQPQMTPQQAPAYHQAGAYEEQQDQDAAVDSEHAQTPDKHFDNVVENMANRAAARHFSAPTDQDISQIATTYGLDAGEIKQSIQGVAVFGNYHGVNGVIGPSAEGPPQGYTEVDLNNNGNGIQSHEAVVPMNLAIRKVSEDLNMDPKGVYDAVQSAYGGDLSDEYHTSVQGEFHFYLPQDLMSKATQHPQPPAPDQQQQQQQPGVPGQQQPGMGQAQPGMGMPQPDISQMPQMASKYILNDQQLEVKLTRDGKLADQRAKEKVTV